MTLLPLTLAARERVAIVAAAVASGVANMIALVLAGQAVRAQAAIGAWDLALFSAAVVAHLGLARWVSHRLDAAIDGALYQIKVRLVAAIQRSPLDRIEAIGSAEIFDRLTENTSVISLAAGVVGTVLGGASVLLFSLACIAWLSPPLLALLVPLQIAALLLYRARIRGAVKVLRSYNEARVRFLDHLMGLLRGAKELKLHRARSREVRADYERASAVVRDASTRFAHLFDDGARFLTCNLYFVLAGLVFVLPTYVAIDEATLPLLVAVTLFVWGNMQAGLGGYPLYVQASEAMEVIAALERKLASADPQDEEAPPQTDGADAPWPGAPGGLELVGIEYVYSTAGEDRAFRVGPIDLSVARGETLFLVGGNGSGKTTLLKTMTGLYTPTRGALRCAGTLVGPVNVAAYRELFSAIFAEFHLFSRAYGLLDASPEQVDPLLRQMQLDGKTRFTDGHFTRRDLSTGQRKRLAMVLALLEDRPILVLDEWPADQDPQFRRYFYEELLPAWKRQGKTVIAVSHDDRFFRCADRVVHLEYGQIRRIVDNRSDEPAG